MSRDAELARIVRRYVAGLERNPGANVPDTHGNQALPIHDTSKGEVSGRFFHGRSDSFPDRDDNGPAFRGAPNAYNWREQAFFQVGPARESIQRRTIPDKGTLIIDPNVAITWVANLKGDAFITFADDEPVELGDFDFQPLHATHVVLIVRRSPGSLITWPADLLWSDDVVDPEHLVAPDPEKAKTDTFTFHKLPPPDDTDPDMPSGWMAYLGARGFGPRTTVQTAATDATPEVS